MVWEHLNKELILPQIDAKDSADIFEQAGGKLVSLGYCKDSYVEALKLREKDFPTGVDMGGVGVAIPHTDVDEKGHLELLQAILGILQDLHVVEKLSSAQNPEEIINIIKEKENSL